MASEFLPRTPFDKTTLESFDELLRDTVDFAEWEPVTENLAAHIESQLERSLQWLIPSGEVDLTQTITSSKDGSDLMGYRLTVRDFVGLDTVQERLFTFVPDCEVFVVGRYTYRLGNEPSVDDLRQDFLFRMHTEPHKMLPNDEDLEIFFRALTSAIEEN